MWHIANGKMVQNGKKNKNKNKQQKKHAHTLLLQETLRINGCRQAVHHAFAQHRHKKCIHITCSIQTLGHTVNPL